MLHLTENIFVYKCILVCTMTLIRYVVQLYKGEIFATEESKRSLHFEQGKAKTIYCKDIYSFQNNLFFGCL